MLDRETLHQEIQAFAFRRNNIAWKWMCMSEKEEVGDGNV